MTNARTRKILQEIIALVPEVRPDQSVEIAGMELCAAALVVSDMPAVAEGYVSKAQAAIKALAPGDRGVAIARARQLVAKSSAESVRMRRQEALEGIISLIGGPPPAG